MGSGVNPIGINRTIPLKKAMANPQFDRLEFFCFNIDKDCVYLDTKTLTTQRHAKVIRVPIDVYNVAITDNPENSEYVTGAALRRAYETLLYLK